MLTRFKPLSFWAHANCSVNNIEDVRPITNLSASPKTYQLVISNSISYPWDGAYDEVTNWPLAFQTGKQAIEYRNTHFAAWLEMNKLERILHKL